MQALVGTHSSYANPRSDAISMTLSSDQQVWSQVSHNSNIDTTLLPVAPYEGLYSLLYPIAPYTVYIQRLHSSTASPNQLTCPPVVVSAAKRRAKTQRLSYPYMLRIQIFREASIKRCIHTKCFGLSLWVSCPLRNKPLLI